ncbi:MAG: single-stranded DNA-binding protein [Amoebophilaceae bacterium]|jgi:single-strand DNA-binding protein|nr:single-stranded DNA-binding protein [Amoebophilaceae bacterium]
MSAVNKVILLGNLGKDPEVRYLENDRIRTTFTLATNETYRNKAGEKVTTTEWHNIVLWASLAKIAEQYLAKGKQVYIEGKLTTRSYVDKEGQVRHTTEVVGQNLVLLGGRPVDTVGAVTGQGEDVPGAAEDESLDGLPF